MMGVLSSMLWFGEKALRWAFQSLLSPTSFSVAVTAFLVPSIDSKTHSLML